MPLIPQRSRSSACLTGFYCRLLLLAGVLLISAGPAFAATRIPLQIDEPLENRSVAWPITTGVPFPRGALTDAAHCRLVDADGTEQPLQSRVTATWDREAKSIRWLTIDFIAAAGQQYWLEFGDEIQRKESPSPLKVLPGEEQLLVETGVLRVEFSRNGPAALGTISLDLDGDGRIAEGEVVASGAASGDHYYVNQQKQRFTGSADGDARQIEVEQSGPVLACIRVDGFYTGPKGERIVASRTRYHLYAGLGLIRLVDEFRITDSTADTRFQDIGLSLALPESTGQRVVSADISAAAGNQTAQVEWTDRTESVSSYQAAYRHYGNPEYEAAFVEVTPSGSRRVAQSDRVGAWLQVADERAVVTGSLRWFWQQFPKEWECTSDALTLHLWSPRGGELDFSPDGVWDFFGEMGRKYVLEWEGPDPPAGILHRYMFFGSNDALRRLGSDGRGISKHHEIFYHFARPEHRTVSAEYGALAGRQPVALASGEWNCGTDVFGPLMSRPNNSKYEAIVDRLFDLSRYAQDSFGDYGWWAFGSGPHYSYQWDATAKRHYADPRRFEFHTYQKETQLWWCYLRSGERKFYDWAIPSENHWADIAVAHVPLKFECDWTGGDRAESPRTLHWQPGDWTVDNAVHFSRNHHNAEAWLRGGSQFWASYHRTLETTTLAYYITGDERFRDVLGYWRDYWADLAGVTGASNDVQPWHREQPWFRPAKPGEPPQTWAEMIRDYAPFSSGMRHQMTLFFSLATLYEHTWDPAIGQVLQEYAAAFLDADGPIGVWMSQDNSGPANADAPWMAHYWLPALWKYHRVTGDPQVPAILTKYFDRLYGADPWRGHLGVYSNVHLAYAWYFTRDPRYLTLAKMELEELLPLAEPLASPQAINGRLYNPSSLIRALTGVPRLIWALNDAKQSGIEIPPPPVLRPQRTAIAMRKQAGQPVRMTVWGYEESPRMLGPDGSPFDGLEVRTKQYTSGIQPFDRTMPDFAVFMHEVTIPADAPAGWFVLAHRLELGVLSLSGAELLVNAARTVSLEGGEEIRLRVPPRRSDEAEPPTLTLQTAQTRSLQILTDDGEQLPVKAAADGTTMVALTGRAPAEVLRLRNISGSRMWLRLTDQPAAHCWASVQSGRLPRETPSEMLTEVALPGLPEVDRGQKFVDGRFGRALQIVRGQELKLPDHVEIDGKPVPLHSLREGTIELWVKVLWDRRLARRRLVTLMTNGPISLRLPENVPYGEWTHLAISWRPANRDPDVSLVQVYVNGRDKQSYRSTWWSGYGNAPARIPREGESRGEFLFLAGGDDIYAIDELRVSSTARYADRDVVFGPQQTFNPFRFEPAHEPLRRDDHTLLHLRFDGDLVGRSTLLNTPVTGSLLKR